MSVFIGEKGKRVELAERKDAVNPNLLLNSKGPFQPQKSSTDNLQIYSGSTIYLEQNQTYTISGQTNGTWSDTHNVDIESDRCVIWFVDGADDAIATIVSSNNQVNNSNQFVWANPTGTYQLRVNGYKPDNSTKAWNIKVEKGAVATPWCPAYEDYAWTSDITNLQNTVNNKVNVDGDLFLAPGAINSWADAQADGQKSVLRSIRTEGQATDFNTGNYDAGILFGGNDTKALISVGYVGNTARVSGGNSTAVWHEDIAWKSDITNLQNQIQADKTANKTDVTNLQSMITGLSTKVDSLQQSSHNIVPITQADYDALSTKDSNTIYAIGG